MLTIAQCSDSFLPVTDGVGRVSYAYARALAERGHAVYAITPMVNGFYRGRHPFEILDFMSMKLPGGPKNQIGMANVDLHYITRADSVPFDLVHTHSPGSAGMEAARLASRLHVPLVGSFHAKYFEECLTGAGDDRSAARSMHALFDYFNRCDEIWTVSEDAKALLLEQGFSGHVEIMDNGTQRFGLSPADEATVRRQFHLGERPLLLYAGRIDHAKNVSQLVDAAAALHAEGLDFCLLFAGQGPAEEALRSLAFRQGLQNVVRFAGHVEEDRLLYGLYATAALCLFPASNISPGLAVREAAAQGTPSLVMKGSTAAAAIRDGENGLIAEPESGAIAARVSAYLAEPGAKARIGMAAKKSLPIGWDEVIGRVEARYEALVSRDRTQLTRKRGLFRKELEQVDQTLNKRTLDLMRRFLKQDTRHLYSYPRLVEKPAFVPGPDPAPLKRSTPEEQGVSSRRVLLLLDQLNAEERLGAQVCLVLRHGHVIAEAQWSPYEASLPHEMYSLSKSVTATAIGMLVDEGKLTLDERLADIFPDKMPEDETHPAHQFIVKQLLTMSTGTHFNELGSVLGADWEREFLHAGVRFTPGTRFAYNSMNTYMLAAIVRRKSGQTLSDYLGPRLFEPLGIGAHQWELSPTGTEKGGWGLNLTAEGAAKIGQLYLNRGLWQVNGEPTRLLSEDWVEAATKAQIETPDGEITYGYGYQIWMTAREGSFLFNGMLGQYMLALPELDMLVVLLSGSPQLFAQGPFLDIVTKAFDTVKDYPLPADPAARDALMVTSKSLSVRYRGAFYRPDWSGPAFGEIVQRLNGLVYRFDENVSGLFPLILMSVHNNFSAGIERIAFRAEEDGLIIEFVEGEARHQLRVCANGYAESSLGMQGDHYIVRTDIQTCALPQGDWLLRLNAHFVETPYTRLVEFRFTGAELTVLFDEYPSLSDAATMLMELAGLSRWQVMRQLMPLLKQERMQSHLRSFATTSVHGRL